MRVSLENMAISTLETYTTRARTEVGPGVAWCVVLVMPSLLVYGY